MMLGVWLNMTSFKVLQLPALKICYGKFSYKEKWKWLILLTLVTYKDISQIVALITVFTTSKEKQCINWNVS